jgi:hypothetical protein
MARLTCRLGPLFRTHDREKYWRLVQHVIRSCTERACLQGSETSRKRFK